MVKTVVRRISKPKYIVVFAITSLIFLLGICFGLVWDNKRVEWATRENKMRDLDYQSLQFQYLYLSSLQTQRNDICDVLYITLEQSVKDLSQTLEALFTYQKESAINDEQYSNLERDYILDNLRYWLFAKQVQEACPKDIVALLYFYGSNCPECNDQGTLLTHFKKVFSDRLLVFPINSDRKHDEPSIMLIEAKYNITKYPSLVIKDKKYEGLVEFDKLKQVVCSSFKQIQPECR